MKKTIYIVQLVIVMAAVAVAQTDKQPERLVLPGFRSFDSLRASIVIGVSHVFPSLPSPVSATISIRGYNWGVHFEAGDRITVNDTNKFYLHDGTNWVPIVGDTREIRNATDSNNILQFRENTDWLTLYVPDPEILASTETNNRLERVKAGLQTILNVPAIDIVYNTSGSIIITESTYMDEASNTQIHEATFEVAGTGGSVSQPTPTPAPAVYFDEQMSAVGGYVEGATLFNSLNPILDSAVYFARSDTGPLSHPQRLTITTHYTISDTTQVQLNFPIRTSDLLNRSLTPRLYIDYTEAP